MNDMKVNLIKIPFASKGKINQKNPNENLVMEGYAIYALDIETREIIHEYIELKESNFRMTDKGMIKPTDHYKREDVRHFRDNFLDPITKHDPNLLIEQKYHQLNNTEIDKINAFFKEQNKTVKTLFSFLSGSNISGAERNPKASPMVCVDLNFFGCNFSNPLKKISSKKNDKNNLYHVEQIINLSDLIEQNSAFKSVFQDFNAWYFNDLDIKPSKNIEILNPTNDENEKYSFKFKDIGDRIKDYLSWWDQSKHKDEWKNTSSFKTMLRRFYVSSILNEQKNGNIPFTSTNENFHSSVIQNAHIIKFSTLVNENTKESIKKSIDPYNVIRIDSNTHIMFDKNIITFDEKGNIINKKNEIERENFLNMSVISPFTVKYIKENYEYWLKHGINK